MYKKIIIAAYLMAFSVVCYGAESVNKPVKTMPNPVLTVRAELARYSNMSNLKKAQLLVSHPDIETQTKTRRNELIGAKNDVITINDNNRNNNLSNIIKKTKQSIIPEDGRPTVLNKEEGLSKAIERVRAQRGLKRRNVTLNSEDIFILKSELEKSKTTQEKLRKENKAMKDELKKNIEAMERLKSHNG